SKGARRGRAVCSCGGRQDRQTKRHHQRAAASPETMHEPKATPEARTEVTTNVTTDATTDETTDEERAGLLHEASLSSLTAGVAKKFCAVSRRFAPFRAVSRRFAPARAVPARRSAGALTVRSSAAATGTPRCLLGR
ncbi:MAG TPA: hypothetical protein PKU97_20005, partial [Kofleriaceae bacterium]|nr:hypothetical protein [Kofleriaceae bacterium]